LRLAHSCLFPHQCGCLHCSLLIAHSSFMLGLYALRAGIPKTAFTPCRRVRKGRLHTRLPHLHCSLFIVNCSFVSVRFAYAAAFIAHCSLLIVNCSFLIYVGFTCQAVSKVIAASIYSVI
jgi:hypothetical protein